MSVTYNSKKLIPVQSVTISPEQNLTGDGQVIGVVFNLTINGTILSYKGSPNSSGVFDTGPIGTYPADETPTLDQNFEFIIRKQEYIRKLFATEGKSLEFQPLTGAAPIKCNPRNIKVEFPGDKWFNKCNYIITCQADILYGYTGVGTAEYGFSEYISEASETWSMEQDFDQPQQIGVGQIPVRVSHNISAKGKRFYDETGTLEKDAWKQARDYVIPRLGFDTGFLLSSGLPYAIGHLRPFNRSSAEAIDELGGTYSITENFLLMSGINDTVAAFDEFEVSKQKGSDSSVTEVSVQGVVRGVEYELSGVLASYKSRYDNANTYFNTISGLIYNRAQQFSNVPNLNVVPLNQTYGINPILGTINYNLSYSDRPYNLFADSLMESVNITNNWNVDAFASVFVIGRASGPVLQDLGTKQARTRGLSIEVVFPTQSGLAGLLNGPLNNSAQSGTLNTIVQYCRPGGTSFVSQQNESWDARTGRFSYNTEWTF